MKRFQSILLVVALTCVAPAVLAVPTVHKRLPEAPARFLYDEPGVLSPGERAEIEDSLMAMDRRGLEIGVAVFQSIHGEPIENVAMALAEKWRPGNAEKDNGLLLVVAIEERKVRVEVGYGLEANITDAAAGRVIRYDIAPAFREGRYGDGILRAVTNLARLAGGQPLPERTSSGMPIAVPFVILLIVIGVVVLIAAAGRHATASRRGWSNRHYGGPFWFGGGGGGGFGGGGFGGGSFGGGSFGGGGASGSW